MWSNQTVWALFLQRSCIQDVILTSLSTCLEKKKPKPLNLTRTESARVSIIMHFSVRTICARECENVLLKISSEHGMCARRKLFAAAHAFLAPGISDHKKAITQQSIQVFVCTRMCMYVCMCVCVCVCVCVCMHMHMHVCAYVCIHVCMSSAQSSVTHIRSAKHAE